MRFAFSAEQQLFRQSVADVLAKECPPTAVRAAWTSDDGQVPGLWRKLADLGIVGLTVPEAHGGLGRDELDLVLLLEEAGRAALPAPFVETTAVAAPLIAENGSAGLRATWLPRIADGTAVVAVGLAQTPFVAEAHLADLLLLAASGELHAVPRDRVKLAPHRSVDGARRLWAAEWRPAADTRVAAGADAARIIATAFDRGALGVAAQLVGLARHLMAVTVEYVKVREQFGKPIGSFQAVKHHLADALLAVEFARPVVYRAAYSTARGLPPKERSLHVSMAKAYAGDAALTTARAALQCHGAIGYSYEHDLHLWMKRAWALAATWGDAAWHRARIGAAILGGE